jgi:hypothetical protein
MAKLADALASGASGREVVQVQVLFRARVLLTTFPVVSDSIDEFRAPERVAMFATLSFSVTCVRPRASKRFL